MLKRFSVFLCFCIVFIGTGTSQTLKVLDRTSLQAIPFVTIYSYDMKLSSITDQRGHADISAFKGVDSIVFRMIGYREYITSYSNLEAANFKVLLTEKRFLIDEVVISVHRWEEKHEDIPNQILKINPSEIAFSNPQTSADVLSGSGEVFVQKSQMGGGSPMIRGFSANSILIVVDGVRMNNAIYRGGNLQNVLSVDPNTLESTEVLFGPGSVIYGSDALGGIMNFNTKKPVISDTEAPFIFANAFTRYATANNEKTGHVQFNVGLKKLAFFSGITYSDFDNLRSGNIRSHHFDETGKREWYVKRIGDSDHILPNPDPNIQLHSAFSQFNILQKVRYKASEKIEIEYGFRYSTTSNIPRYDRLIELAADQKPRNAEWHYGPQKWIMHNLNASIKHHTLLFDDIKITLAYQDYEESRIDRKFNSDLRRTQAEAVGIASINTDFKKEAGEKNEFYYGLEAFTNNVSSAASRQDIISGSITPAASRYPNGGSQVYSGSAYMQVIRKLNKKLTFSGGSRYSYYTLNSNITDTAFFKFPYSEIHIQSSTVTGSAGLVFHPSKKWRLNVNAASGFRAPNVDDIAKVFDSEPGSVVVPNPDLGPEYSYTVEAGISRTFNERYTVSSNAYYTWVVDAIERRNFTFNGRDSILYDGVMSLVTANVNAAQAYISGISFNFKADITNNTGIACAVTYTEGMDKTNELPLRHIPPVFGRAEINYKAKKFKGEFFTHFSGWKHFDELPPEEQAKKHIYTPYGSPAWFTLNVAASYQLNQAFQLNAGLENILDRHYRPFASGISAAGRNFFLALRVRL